jgi:hypothetical protein
MSTEYETVASLWNTFHSLVQEQDEESVIVEGEAGLPGTGTRLSLNPKLREITMPLGGHVVLGQSQKDSS